CIGDADEPPLAPCPENVIGADGTAAHANDIDDRAGLALLHLRDVELAQVNIAEHLERPGLLPPLQTDVGDTAARNGSGIVDKDLNAEESLMEAQALGGIVQVREGRPDLGVVLAAR